MADGLVVATGDPALGCAWLPKNRYGENTPIMAESELGAVAPPVAVLVRLSSKRLPAKALLRFGRDVLIGSVVDGVSRATLPSGSVVVTSDQESDDPLVRWCTDRAIQVMRGPLENVADRLLRCADSLDAPAVVRISGDSPFIDPSLIDHAVALWMRDSLDLVTNVFPRSYPKGQSVEVISTQALRELLQQSDLEPEDLEHVTPAFYRSSSNWRIRNFTPRGSELTDLRPIDLPSLQMSVDDETDLQLARLVATQVFMDERIRPSWTDVARAYFNIQRGSLDAP